MFFELNRRVIFFYRKFDGGDVDENRHFIEGKWVAHYQKFKNYERNINNLKIFMKFFDGGDVNENRHFKEGKWVAHYQNFKNSEKMYYVNNFI